MIPNSTLQVSISTSKSPLQMREITIISTQDTSVSPLPAISLNPDSSNCKTAKSRFALKLNRHQACSGSGRAVINYPAQHRHFSQDYKMGDFLGYGSDAIVKKCTHKSTGQVYAVKIFDKSRLSWLQT